MAATSDTNHHAARDHLSQVLNQWKELVCFKSTGARLAELVDTVGSLAPQLYYVTLDALSVRVLFNYAVVAQMEWPMCCLLRHLGQLTTTGLIELVWVERALACWAATAQGNCTLLFQRDPTSCSGLSIASWESLVERICVEARTQLGPTTAAHTVRDDVATRVVVAMLGWDCAVLTFSPTMRATPTADEASQCERVFVVRGLSEACQAVASARAALPRVDVCFLSPPVSSTRPSPRFRFGAGGAEQLWPSLGLTPAADHRADERAADHDSDRAALKRTSRPSSSRLEVRRGTLAPDAVSHSATPRSATRRPIDTKTDTHRASSLAAKGHRDTDSAEHTMRSADGSLCSGSDGSLPWKSEDSPASMTATPTPACTPPPKSHNTIGVVSAKRSHDSSLADRANTHGRRTTPSTASQRTRASYTGVESVETTSRQAKRNKSKSKKKGKRAQDGDKNEGCSAL